MIPGLDFLFLFLSSNEDNSFVKMVKCEIFSSVLNFLKMRNFVGVNLLRFFFSCSSLSLFDFLQHKTSFFSMFEAWNCMILGLCFLFLLFFQMRKRTL